MRWEDMREAFWEEKGKFLERFTVETQGTGVEIRFRKKPDEKEIPVARFHTGREVVELLEKYGQTNRIDNFSMIVDEVDFTLVTTKGQPKED